MMNRDRVEKSQARSRAWGRRLTQGLWVAAAIASGVTVQRLVLPAFAPPTPPWVVVPQPQRLLRGGISTTPDGAAFGLAVFWDYGCSGCLSLGRRLDASRRKAGGKLNLVFHLLPVTGSSGAGDAAKAAYCANQRSVFERFHSSMLAQANELSLSARLEHALRAAGISHDEYARCLVDPSVAEALAADSALASDLGIGVTPVLGLGGALYVGAPRKLEAMLGDSLRAAHSRAAGPS